MRSLYPPGIRIAIVCDNFSPHLTTKKCQRMGTWAAANNVEIAYTPTNSSWLNRIEAQFTCMLTCDDATQVAEWAGHSVDVLLKIYAKCIDGDSGTPSGK